MVRKSSRFITVIYTILLVLLLMACNRTEHGLYRGDNIKLFEETPVYELAKAVLEDDTAQISYLVKVKKLPLEYRERVWKESIIAFACCNDKKLSFDKLLDLGAEIDVPKGANSFVRTIADNGQSEYLGSVLSKRKISKETIGYVILASKEACLDTLISRNLLKEDSLGIAVYNAVDWQNYSRAIKLLENGACFNDSVQFEIAPNISGNHTITDLLENYKSIYSKFYCPESEKDRKRLVDYLNQKYKLSLNIRN